ncbi:MAG: selenocysteine-specific translation elongation factor [Actinomycetota bacterium]
MIIGTAGHIDHGKTVLITALTGVNTDRLAEEQKRGISIDLGFAEFNLPSGRTVGVVDVPGHEAFIKNMLAGASGFDLALIVVAADDGVMPQTREHVAIINLLSVKRAVVAITKADLVDNEMIELVKADIKDFLKGTPLQDAPVIAVSAVTGDGLPDLMAALDKAADEIEARQSEGYFRLPVDRVFTLRGAGTVITGTLWSGTLRQDDNAEIMPAGLPARVRSVQIHGKLVKEAFPGNRVAVNLPGIDKSAIHRGEILVPAGSARSSYMFDAEFTLLADASAPLKNWTRVRVHHGTAEVMGRVVILDAEHVKPGGRAYVQFRLEKPLVPLRGDRFIIRSYSPMTTIGGGEILFGHARRRKRFDEYAVALLDAAYSDDLTSVLQLLLNKRGGPIAADELSRLTDALPPAIEAALNTLIDDGRVAFFKGDKPYYIASTALTELENKVAEAVKAHHVAQPLEAGIGKETLRSRLLRRFDTKAANVLLTSMATKGSIKMEGDAVMDPSRTPGEGAEHDKVTQAVGDEFQRAGLAPPTNFELQENFRLTAKEVNTVISALKKIGVLIQVADGVYLHEAAIVAAEAAARKLIEENGKMTVSEFKDKTGTTRKYAVPLLEYFDRQKITKRDGDYRVLV